MSHTLHSHKNSPSDVQGGGKPKGLLAGQFIGHGCRLLGGAPNQPGVGQHSLDGQSVQGVVLQQPGNQIFGSSTDIGMCRIGILHLDDKTSGKMESE